MLHKAIMKVMRPLVRLVLKQGMSYGDFAEITRRAFVDVAYRDFSIPKRKPTIASVAVITGLNRKEVVRLSAHDLNADDPENAKINLNRAQRVVNGWLTDPHFLNSSKRPRDLSLRKGTGSFHDLVKKYSGDITGRAILDEMIRLGVAEKLDKRMVRLIAQGFVPFTNATEKLEIGAMHVGDLINTINTNLHCKPGEENFQRQVTYHDVPLSVIEEFRAISYEKSDQLISELNQWLAKKKRGGTTRPNEPLGRVGTGVYVVVDTTKELGDI